MMMRTKMMNEFIEIAQANFARAEKEKAILAKRLKAEQAFESIKDVIRAMVFLLCTVSIIANMFLLVMIALDLVSR